MKAFGYIPAFLVIICLQACSSSPEGKNSYQEPRYYEETFYMERKGVYRLGNFLVEERAREPVLKTAALLDGRVRRDREGDLHYTTTGLSRRSLVEACRLSDRDRDGMVAYREALHFHTVLFKSCFPE